LVTKSIEGTESSSTNKLNRREEKGRLDGCAVGTILSLQVDQSQFKSQETFVIYRVAAQGNNYTLQSLLAIVSNFPTHLIHSLNNYCTHHNR